MIFLIRSFLYNKLFTIIKLIKCSYFKLLILIIDEVVFRDIQLGDASLREYL